MVTPHPHEHETQHEQEPAHHPVAGAAPGEPSSVAPLPDLADERRLLADLEAAVAAIDAELGTLDAPRSRPDRSGPWHT